MKISIIMPAYNEAENLAFVFDGLQRVADADPSCEYEFVFVDDHSSDETPYLLRKFAKLDTRVCVLRFSRNFGSHAACTAGLAHCTGDAAVILAADGQDPPELIPRLLESWQKGSDVVWAVREQREGESYCRVWFSQAYYALMQRFALAEMPPEGADFFLIDRRVIDTFNQTSERNTSILALILWMGFNQTSVPYVKKARHGGRSKWTLKKKLKLAVDSFVGFSYVPIRLMSYLGLTTALLGMAYALAIISNRVIGGIPVEGWSSLMVVVLLTAGVQLTMLGVLGEYLWRALEEGRGRPRYIIESSFNLPSAPREKFRGEVLVNR